MGTAGRGLDPETVKPLPKIVGVIRVEVFPTGHGLWSCTRR